MIKIAALTSGKCDPASRFRIRQHITSLKDMDIEVHEYTPLIDKYAKVPFWPEKINVKYYGFPIGLMWHGLKLATQIPGILSSWLNHITWLQRDLLPGCLTFELLLKKPLVFDVDDAIWLNRLFGKQSLIAIARRADVIIAGNNYIASWFEPYSQRIFIVPTAIDTERFKPGTPDINRKNDKFIIGWTGSSATLKYLEAIEDCLRKFLIDHPDSEILVIADKAPKFKTLPTDRLQFISWSEDIETKAIKRMDVGIMPLPDNEWTRGKCSFKILQYMACGIPVIVSPVGMNKEVLTKGALGLAANTDSDWYDAFSFFYKNRASAKAYGQTGRIIVEKNYSQKVISKQLAGIFKELL